MKFHSSCREKNIFIKKNCILIEVFKGRVADMLCNVLPVYKLLHSRCYICVFSLYLLPTGEDERRSGNKSKHRNNESSPYRYSPLPKIKPTHSPPHRVEYNHNGDIKTENGRLSDSWGSNRDKRTPPPPRSVPRTPTRPKVSREFTPRNQTPREESHRAPPRSSPSPTDHRKRANQNQEPGSGTYTNHTNEDSGINVNSPEDHFDALDRSIVNS